MSWVVGVGISCFSSVTLNLGINVQKLALNKNSALPKEKQKAVIRQPTWLFGLGIFILGNIGDFVALSFASPTVLAPLGSISLVSNVIFATLLLRERFGFLDALAVAVVATGAVMAVLAGSHEDVPYGVEQILALMARPQFLAFEGVLLITWPVVFMMLKSMEKHSVKPVKEEGRAPTMRDRVVFIVAPILWGVLIGTIGSQTALLGKASGELVKTTLAGDSQLGNPAMWIILGGVGLAAVMQVVGLNLALKYFDSLFIIPCQYTAWLMSSVIGSMIMYIESPNNPLMFYSGAALTICGVGLLSVARYVAMRKALKGARKAEQHKEADRVHAEGAKPEIGVPEESRDEVSWSAEKGSEEEAIEGDRGTGIGTEPDAPVW
ncbi:magnesium transporter NIPA [Kipferlia bialata]|uniref:Magnesium transporter NIPA n=1 Tax=Kipferlia bialata TaxID=797122 RepID=A0A9K3CPP0_9EUKA|nr:magnesium transporter NIPA [Kipferlia bialata]|eukprot:g1932.t1